MAQGKRVVPVSALEALARQRDRTAAIRWPRGWMRSAGKSSPRCMRADGRDVLIPPVRPPRPTVLTTWSDTVDLHARHLHWRRRRPPSPTCSVAKSAMPRVASMRRRRSPAPIGQIAAENASTRRAAARDRADLRPAVGCGTRARAAHVGHESGDRTRRLLDQRGCATDDDLDGRRRARSGLVHEPLVARDARHAICATPTSSRVYVLRDGAGAAARVSAAAGSSRTNCTSTRWRSTSTVRRRGHATRLLRFVLAEAVGRRR